MNTQIPEAHIYRALIAERDTLRAEVERIRLALNICLGILQEDYPDECDGRGAPARNPGRHRDAKAQARAALAPAKVQS